MPREIEFNPGFMINFRSLSFYANGVYYEEKCRNDSDGLDHAVLAVGYGVMHGQVTLKSFLGVVCSQ